MQTPLLWVCVVSHTHYTGPQAGILPLQHTWEGQLAPSSGWFCRTPMHDWTLPSCCPLQEPAKTLTPCAAVWFWKKRWWQIIKWSKLLEAILKTSKTQAYPTVISFHCSLCTESNTQKRWNHFQVLSLGQVTHSGVWHTLDAAELLNGKWLLRAHYSPGCALC